MSNMRCAAVLFVDDNQQVCEFACRHLTASGYSVSSASDGFSALALIEQVRPDIVVADMLLPRIDGFQICALMKGNPDYSHIPVIMLSGVGGLLEHHRAPRVGCAATLSKPFTAKAIVDTVTLFIDTPKENDR